jgi:hypothetical protein
MQAAGFHHAVAASIDIAASTLLFVSLCFG